MLTNTKKTTSALPRSFSKTTMTSEITHMPISGASVRRSGNQNGPTFLV